MKVIATYRVQNSTFDADRVDVLSINHERIEYCCGDKPQILSAKVRTSSGGRYFFTTREIKIYVDMLNTEDGKLLLAQ